MAMALKAYPPWALTGMDQTGNPNAAFVPENLPGSNSHSDSTAAA
jgi:hypothetical protein